MSITRHAAREPRLKKIVAQNFSIEKQAGYEKLSNIEARYTRCGGVRAANEAT